MNKEITITNYYFDIDNTRYWYTDSSVALERLIHHMKQRGKKLSLEDLTKTIKRLERTIDLEAGT